MSQACDSFLLFLLAGSLEGAAIYFRRLEKEGTDSEPVSVKEGSPPYEVAVHHSDSEGNLRW